MKKTPLFNAKGNFDLKLFLLVVFLVVFGLTALYSASTVESYKNFGITTRYIVHQVLYGGAIGLIAMYVCYKIDYSWFKKILPVMLGLSLLSLFLVKFSSLGYQAGGATRWLDLGPFSFQPSELVKITIVVYMAAWLERKQHALDNFWQGLFPSLFVVGLMAALILAQPDFGTMLMVIIIAFIMLYAGGLSRKYLIFGLLGLGLVLYLFIHFEPYRAQRLMTFLNPEIDPRGISYQVNQSLLAIGAGGQWGYGYGLSRQKYNYLPASYTDSIFAVTAEELGFWRSVLILAGFFLLCVKGLSIANSAPDTFGKLMAVGLTSWLTFQAIINISALSGLLPLTGIPLPFFSYGSTALLANMSAIGILLNISKQSK